MIPKRTVNDERCNAQYPAVEGLAKIHIGRSGIGGKINFQVFALEHIRLDSSPPFRPHPYGKLGTLLMNEELPFGISLLLSRLLLHPDLGPQSETGLTDVSLPTFKLDIVVLPEQSCGIVGNGGFPYGVILRIRW